MILLLLSGLLNVAWCEDLTFPAGFKFGAATSSYQIEGGWNASDKSESIWDVQTHTRPHSIRNNGNGDVACDSYHQWRRDVEMASEVGLDFYRFSISWPRVLPSGFSNKISEAGAKYYSDLIDGLLEKGIEPVITMYHWDLPQSLQDLGGWTNPMISDWFEDYARVLFKLYGDRVKTWITINEAVAVCDVGYGLGIFAPGVQSPEYGKYICAKNILMAHGKAWRVYDKEFREKYKGSVGITTHLMWMEPATEADEERTELAIQLSAGLYSHAIFSKEGGWPPALEKFIKHHSKKEGYPSSRLPAFTDEERNLIRGTYDFFGFNHYTSRVVRKLEEGTNVIWPISGSSLLGVKLETRPEWKATPAFWLFEYPEGMRRQLNWLRQQYGDIKILITENGYPTTKDDLDDPGRIQYLNRYLEQVLLAIKEDKLNIIGYTVWSLMDNFEWTGGYLTRFGLYNVDYTDGARTRTPRASAHYYANVIKSRSLKDINKISYDEL